MAGNQENVTIKEIARRAGVSVSTVSRVMSGKKTAIPISEKTRKKVLKVCNELKFLPDVNYMRLQERRSYTIGFLVPRTRPDSPNPLFVDDNIGRALSEMELCFAEKGYSTLVQTVDSDYEEARTHLRILRNNSVDGLIIWDAFRDKETVSELMEEHRPSICIALPYDTDHNCIVPDNFQGAYDMTRHLLSLGHKRIAYINGGMGELTDALREQGYRKAMSEAGQEPIVAIGNYRLESGAECAHQLLSTNSKITAIFAAGDLMAIGVLEYAREKGIAVPEKLAVAGFDGSIVSGLTTPRLTTCELPMSEIGRLAAETVIAMVENGEGSVNERVKHILPVKIIQRESTVGKVKAAAIA
jgi:DNA-binding LacI/PurR family transcriptional regulator